MHTLLIFQFSLVIHVTHTCYMDQTTMLNAQEVWGHISALYTFAYIENINENIQIFVSTHHTLF